MDASDLRPWGQQLDATARARALAGIGVGIAANRSPTLSTFLAVVRRDGISAFSRALAGDVRVPWDIRPLLDGSTDERAELERLLPARLMADAWELAQARMDRPIRLQIRTRWDAFEPYRWILDQLGSAKVGAAPFVPARLTASRANWQWPVRFGLLTADDALHAVLARETGWDELVDWVRVEGPHTPCDVLLLAAPRTGMPLEPLVPCVDDLDVGCILALGRGLSHPALESATDLRTFLARNRVQAWGVALVAMEPKRAGRFLHEFVRELSHDATLDVALQNAARAAARLKIPRPASSPMLFASPGALDEARVREYGGRLVEVLATANGGAEAITREVGTPDALRDTLRNRHAWRSESGGATTIARASRAARSSAAARPTPIRPRRVQAAVFERDAEAASGGHASTRQVSGALRSEADYELEVSIRYPHRGAVQANATIDLASLPQDRRRHRLQVAFQELRTDAQAQQGQILIRGDEESSSTRFGFRPATDGVYAARIIISYRNRILQMVRFEADVGARSGRTTRAAPAAARRTPQRLLVESSARASMTDLAHRRTFDFAVVANHSHAGDPVIGVLKKGRYRQLGAGDISQDLAWFEQQLGDLATHVGPLNSKQNDRLFRDLAIRGTRLYNHLNNWQRGKEPLEPKHGRLQIVAGSPDAYFPIEFVYDKGLPADDAKLCKNARKALLAGTCPAQCPPEGEEASVICPLGFWGLSRVVERHAFMSERPVGVGESVLLAEPATGRNELRPFDGAAYAASDRVDGFKKGSIQLVARSLAKAVERPTKPVATWPDWIGSIKSAAPPLLVLICHTDQKRRAGQPAVQFEIGASGARQWLDVDGITRRHVLGPAGAPNPVILLIGCSTAVQRVQFSNAVANFIGNGAAIVLSTLATILGEHAAITTARLIERLTEMPRARDVTFGDALLKVRRELLAEDVPMVLALVAFGDADWRLARKA